MYPKFTLPFGDDIQVYSFGFFLAISIIAFIWMSRRMMIKKELSTRMLFSYLFITTVSTLFFARLFHLILYSGMDLSVPFDMSHPIRSFLIVPELPGSIGTFHLTLTGMIVGFIIIQYLLTRRLSETEKLGFLDSYVTGFLFALIFGYIGALLGGQIFGDLSSSSFALDYSIQNPRIGDDRFPLPIIYIFVSGVIFSATYMMQAAGNPPGRPSAVAMIGFGAMLLIWEFFNAATLDNFSSFFGLSYLIADLGNSEKIWSFLNFNQIFGICLIILAVWWLRRHPRDS